jgi:hypothetical protein
VVEAPVVFELCILGAELVVVAAVAAVGHSVVPELAAAVVELVDVILKLGVVVVVLLVQVQAVVVLLLFLVVAIHY